MTGKPASRIPLRGKKEEKASKPVCPIHHWLPLKHFPKDEIRNWECSKCGWMAKDEYIKKMTPELMAQIKKDYEDLTRHYTERPARMQAERIKAQVDGFKRDGKDKQKEADEYRKKNKNVKSITDYTK